MRFLSGLALAVGLVAAAGAAVATCGGGGEVPAGSRSDGVEEEAVADRATSGAGGATGRPNGRRGPRLRAGEAEAESPDAESAPESGPSAGRRAIIQGIVKWPDGTPVADALVTLGDLEVADIATTTAADGTFGIDEFVTYFRVEAASVRDGRLWWGIVGVDGGPLDVELTLEPRIRLCSARVVRVVGWDGGAVASGHATVLRSGGGVTERRRGERVAIAGGRFVADTEPDEDGASALYVVTDARDADGRPLPYGPALVDAERLGDLVTEVRLPPGVTLAGRVIGPDDAPVEGALLEFEPPSPDRFDAAHMARWRESVLTAADGSVSFCGIPRGKGRLRVCDAGELAEVADLEVTCGGDEVVVRLAAKVAVTITVTNEAGKPLAGAGVACIDVFDRTDSKTGADGKAHFAGLRPGVAMTLVADHVDGVSTARKGWIAADTTVVLPRSFPIEGRVTDAAGRPLPEARLSVERRRPESPDGVVRIYDDGRFVVPDMADGDEAELRLMDGMRLVARVAASAGAKDVHVVWDDPDRFGVVFARGSWDMWNGHPDAVLRAEGRELAAADTSPRLATFPAAGLPDRVDLQLGPFSGGRFAVLRNVEPRGLLRVPAEAWRDGRRLSGTVMGPEEGAVPRETFVTVEDDAGFAVRVRVYRDGTFEIPGVPHTALRVRAATTGTADEILRSEVHSVDAGDKPTTLDLHLRK